MKIVNQVILFQCSAESVEEPEEEQTKKLLRRGETDLPHDVIIDILLKLPLKSLTRFKCACIVWYDLITSPDFITKHTKKNKVSVFIDSCHTATRRRKRPKTTRVCFRFSDVAFDLTIPRTKRCVEIVGSARGLICLCLSTLNGKYLIWNPTTGDSREIHDSSARSLTDYDSSEFQSRMKYSGFYFDPFHNTFKVARIVFQSGVEDILHIRLFSLCSNSSWVKKKLVIPVQIKWPNQSNMSPVTCMNTSMYWNIMDKKANYLYILCVDLVAELIRRIEYPQFASEPQFIYLAPYEEGSLSLFACYDRRFNVPAGLLRWPNSYFDVWVLNDHSDTNQSWSKLRSKMPYNEKTSHPAGFFLKDGIYSVAVSSSEEVLCISETGYCRKISRTKGRGSYAARGFFLYNESLNSVY